MYNATCRGYELTDKYRNCCCDQDEVATFLAEMYEELCARPPSNQPRPSTFETLMDRRDEILQALLDAYSARQQKWHADRRLPKLTKARRRAGVQSGEHAHPTDQRMFNHAESTSTFDPKEMLSISTGDGTRFGDQLSSPAGPHRSGRYSVQDDPLVGRARGRDKFASGSSLYNAENMVAIGPDGHYRPYQHCHSQPRSPPSNLLTLSISSER